MSGVDIKQLSDDVASRISTAAVVASLEGAVRQLVDNSLDAGATNIEIRADENGFNAIEVIDNGSGIEPENFDRICKPHHTSKLTDLTGFQNLTTLGFRGQALNALCALGIVSIHTRAPTSPIGTKMTFDHRGNQIGRINVARQAGTTIKVDCLFKPLPVRRREFEKTSKREFTKVLSCIQCFALSRPDVKFICTNSVGGKRSQLICTSGSGSMKELVNNLFGGRLDKNKMLELKRTIPDDEICSIYGLDSEKVDSYDEIALTGFVSSCEQGYGRSSTDRQFVYVNKRPIDYGKVSSTVNEVYRQYNKKQYPSLVLFIQVPACSIDVNVTPDKRTVFFNRERELLALLRSSLKTTFEDVLSTVDNSFENRMFQTSQKPNLSAPSVYDLLRDLSAPKKRPAGGLAAVSTQKKSKTDQETSKTLQDYAFKVEPHKSKGDGVTFDDEEDSVTSSTSVQETPGKSQDAGMPKGNSSDFNGREEKSHENDASIKLTLHPTIDDVSMVESPAPIDRTAQSEETVVMTPVKEKCPPRRAFNPSMLSDISRGLEVHNPRVDDEVLDDISRRMGDESHGASPAEGQEDVEETPRPSTSEPVYYRPQQKIKFSLASFRGRMQQIKASRLAKSEIASQLVEYTAPAHNKEEAEAELSRRLSKTDLARMTMVGQFNKAFIIARLDDQLFIVDQHAADEKYNFERFQRKAKIATQKLLSPQLLDFGRVQEMVIRDNLTIFQANGFEFDFREDAEGCTRAYLVGLPVIYSRQFDKHDIDEIISVVREFPGQMYRPAKTRAIFASRACRKSVMVGTALTVPHMKRIVHNLSTLNQPWNCPHGRPTLRHLLNLHRLLKNT